MKKLMMMVAAACVASFASAAQIVWYPAYAAYTIDSGSVDNSAMVLIVTAAGADAPTVSLDGGNLVVSGGTIAGYGANVAKTNGKSTLNGNWDSDGASYTAINGSETVAADFASHDYYEVIFDSATIANSSKYQIAGVLTDKKATKNTGTLTLSFNGKQLSAENWTNIPEPCTVALLALGMGALALRRKQR